VIASKSRRAKGVAPYKGIHNVKSTDFDSFANPYFITQIIQEKFKVIVYNEINRHTKDTVIKRIKKQNP